MMKWHPRIKKRLLLVDDERDFIDTIKRFLEPRGYATVIAYNGKEALEKATRGADLILLDIMMPGMDGFEVLRRLRSDPATKGIPIIMLTAKAETKDIFEAKGLKATDYLIKPVSMEDLALVLGRYLDQDKRTPADLA